MNGLVHKNDDYYKNDNQVDHEFDLATLPTIHHGLCQELQVDDLIRLTSVVYRS